MTITFYSSALLSMSLHLDHKQDNSLSTASVVCSSKSKPTNRRSSKLPQNGKYIFHIKTVVGAPLDEQLFDH